MTPVLGHTKKTVKEGRRGKGTAAPGIDPVFCTASCYEKNATEREESNRGEGLENNIGRACISRGGVLEHYLLIGLGEKISARETTKERREGG